MCGGRSYSGPDAYAGAATANALLFDTCFTVQIIVGVLPDEVMVADECQTGTAGTAALETTNDTIINLFKLDWLH